MTDEPDDPRGDSSGASDPTAGDDRPGLVAGEAAAIARFGDGPALFSADVPAPRHPHVGPLLPHRRLAFRAGAGDDDAAAPRQDAPAERPAPSSGTDLVPAPRHLPSRRAEDLESRWRRVGQAARRGVEAAVDWTAWSVVAAVTALGSAAQAVVSLVFGPERAALPEGRRR